MGLITPWIAIGRNLVVPYDKAVGRRGNYTFGHETAHYYQQISQGYSKFLARGAYEQWLMVNNPYTTPGTQEWAAHNLWKSY